MIKLLKTIKHLRPQSSAAFLGTAFWIIVLGLGMMTSCTKNPSLVGSNLIPDRALNVNYTDTVSLRTYTRTSIDTTVTSHLGYAFIGSMKDPVFGITDASFYTEFIQAYTSWNFGTNPVPDSLIMQFAYDTVYGDTTKPLTLHVYELSSGVYNDSTYHENSTVSHYLTDYADFTFVPHTGNYYVSDSDTTSHILRINLSKISNVLAEKLINADTSYLDSTALFQNYFKGLYFTVTQVSNGGAIPVFSPLSTNTNLTLYYHNDSTDSLSYQMYITDSCGNFNHYTHLYNTGSSKFVNQVVQKDTALGQQQFYVQGLNGVETVIKFPFIREFARRMGDSISINEAKLVLPCAESSPYLGAPSSLSLIQIASDTSYYYLADQTVEGSTFFGGSYKASTNSYVFRITHYIQTLIQDTTRQNIGLLLYVANSATTPQRIIINGPKPVNDTLTGAKLEVLYTKLPPK